MTAPTPACAASGRATPARPLLIHAGLPRTGTTTLQTHLFGAHSEVDYLGVYKGKLAARRRGDSLCRDPEVAALMDELLFARNEAPDFGRARELWRELRGRAAGRVPVWSWEGLATDVAETRERRARNLARALGPARVLIAVRHPVTLVESTYFQILRRNNRRATRPEDSTGVWYEPIDEWLNRNLEGELAPILDYAGTVEAFRGAFGADAVTVVLFEQLGADPEAFVRRVCELAGIGAAEGLRLTAGKVENRTTGTLVSRIRLARRLPFGTALARLAVADDLRHGGERGAVPTVGEAGRALLAERTCTGNRWLQETLGLDLERWGYPL